MSSLDGATPHGLLHSLQHSAQKLVSRFMSARSNGQRARRVSFQPTTAVFEFERQLFGGGGMPDDDNVSLGLGPRLLGKYEGPLVEKDGKDEYGGTGSLREEERLELLAEFESEQTI